MKPIGEPEQKGKRCPRCGEVYERAVPAWAEWNFEDIPHEDPLVCIERLHSRLEEVERRLDSHNL